MTHDCQPTDASTPANSSWPRLTKADINAFPMRAYEGPIHLIESEDALRHAIRRLRRETVLGFDTETRPTFHRNENYLPSLLQLAGEHGVYLYQLQRHGFSKALRGVLAAPDIIKAGVALDRDLAELRDLAPFTPGGFVDLGVWAKDLGLQNHGLRGLAAALLGFRISKRCQTSNWSRPTLSSAQLRYAATDAWVGRQVYFKLRDLAASEGAAQ